MMMTVKETPRETRVSVYNERSAKSTGRMSRNLCLNDEREIL